MITLYMMKKRAVMMTHHDNNIVQNMTTEAMRLTTYNKVTLYKRARTAQWFQR